MSKAQKKSSRGVQSLMRSMAELKGYADNGMTMDDIVTHYRKHHPERVRTVITADTVKLSEPRKYGAGSVKALRAKLGMSQAVFANSLGVSTVLVQSWEQGTRDPSPLARRLLDVVSDDPAAWLARLAG